MKYLVKLQDAAGQHAVVFNLREFDAKRPAIDFVLDIVGASDPDELVGANMVKAEQLGDLRQLQSLIFDHDAEGRFIRENVTFKLQGKDLDPDTALIKSFAAGIATADAKEISISVEELDLSAGGPAQSSASTDQIALFSQMMFLHQIAAGSVIDVTKEIPELSASIAEAERNGWIEIDVKSVSYKLTAEGKQLHDSYIAEAQDLIKRFDIYGDVDIDNSGAVHFDSGLGKDMRVPVFEIENIDPFRARFVIGLNDGEWDKLSNWPSLYKDPIWYKGIFKDVEQAPGVRDVGESTLRRVIDAGKGRLREDIFVQSNNGFRHDN
jgi:hypothetical protein